MRFSTDESPYKTNQGGYVSVAEATGWYAEISTNGFRTGGGCHRMDPATLAAYRDAVDDERRGVALQQIIAELRESGWEVAGDRLSTAPGGWPRDHPRIELLRHRSLTTSRWVTDHDIVSTPALLVRVRSDWEGLRPLVQWLRGVVVAA